MNHLIGDVKLTYAQLRFDNLGNKAASSPSTKAQRKHQRRLTRDESRFHSGIP
ncbi:hypothetical protein WUBG_19189 [Wuchereria bancrofti]|uniref:Uncharacterized protein n=1 Tax=Wuchereria bancrofti TaxID=6293 RepID=J9E3C6_WUCBA|nr:hypothetical protein WUBG_19189 [Wuchereria bancrofti]